jgi:hypothetical protein
MVLDITAKEWYSKLEPDRSAVTDRAEKNAKITVPYLFMEEGTSNQDDLEGGYVTGYGAKLINHLTGKFALSILPPSQPFYRLEPSIDAMDNITQGDEKAKQTVTQILAEVEEGIMRFVNKSKFRKSLYPALRLAIVTGECMIERLKDDTYMVISLRN